jgi:hypothetical protein
MDHVLPALAFALFIAAHVLALVFCAQYNKDEKALRDNREMQVNQDVSRHWRSFADM